MKIGKLKQGNIFYRLKIKIENKWELFQSSTYRFKQDPAKLYHPQDETYYQFHAWVQKSSNKQTKKSKKFTIVDQSCTGDVICASLSNTKFIL